MRTYPWCSNPCREDGGGDDDGYDVRKAYCVLEFLLFIVCTSTKICVSQDKTKHFSEKLAAEA